MNQGSNILHGYVSLRMAKDPICGMTVNEKTARLKSEHEGTTYYFCSPQCKKTFDGNPRKYAHM